MLIDLLSQSNYVNFNVRLAHIIGLHPSIYISQLIDINEKAIRKDKVDSNFFKVDRKYIEHRTTISVTEQKDIENKLIKIGVINRKDDNSDIVSIDITTLTSIVASLDEDLIKDITFITNPEKKKKTKAQKITEQLKANIITSNDELRQAYHEWIDSVITKDGFMTVAAVRCAQVTVDSFSNHNLDVALKVLEIGAINAYRDINWAIDLYKSRYPLPNAVGGYQSQNTHTTTAKRDNFTRVKVSDEIF